MSENTTEEVESQEENTVVEPGQEADPVQQPLQLLVQ